MEAKTNRNNCVVMGSIVNVSIYPTVVFVTVYQNHGSKTTGEQMLHLVQNFSLDRDVTLLA